MSLETQNSFSSLTKDELLSLDFLTEIYSTDDDVLLSTYINDLEDRAKALKCLAPFRRLVKAFEKERRQTQKELAKAAQVVTRDETQPDIVNYTNYPAGCKAPFESLACGDWIANKNGVKKVFANGEYVASLFPIWPICYYRNVNNNVEKVLIAYYKNKVWQYRTLLRSEIASTQEMLKRTTNFGFPVSSKTAAPLVEFFQEVEALNEDVIPVKRSTTKMGWHTTENDLVFMPYTDVFDFDGDYNYNDLYACIHEAGDYDVWLDEVKKIRATKRFEPLFFLAASFASPLLELLGVQSFAVNLWGNTEGGKTITTRLASSVWADNRKGKYWGTFQSTEVAYEIKQGFLNNLPMFIDDSSDIKDKEHFNYSTFTYNRCAEKGKSRSNISRGIEMEYTWRQIVLMTGEQPFISDNAQGGAINRTLEISCGSTAIYDNPQELLDVLDNNYGFAGRLYIEAIKAITPHKVKEIYKYFLEKVNALNKMKKQSNALAAVLTGDYIAEKVIFKDGVTIDINTASTVLVDADSISEDTRCYNYLLEQVAINVDHFVPISANEETKAPIFKYEQWGIYSKSKDVIFIIKAIFDKFCIQGGFSPKRFLDWAAKNGKIQVSNSGAYTKVKWLTPLTAARCVAVFLPKVVDEDEEEDREALAEGIPF